MSGIKLENTPMTENLSPSQRVFETSEGYAAGLPDVGFLGPTTISMLTPSSACECACWRTSRWEIRCAFSCCVTTWNSVSSRQTGTRSPQLTVSLAVNLDEKVFRIRSSAIMVALIPWGNGLCSQQHAFAKPLWRDDVEIVTNSRGAQWSPPLQWLKHLINLAACSGAQSSA